MPKVLIVDDQPEIRRLWEVNLAARSYDVVVAGDGQECLDMVEAERPDIILLDLTMPVLSGWAVLEALRGSASIEHTAVIVLTGWADEEVHHRARQMGATGALVKPFGIDELLVTIELAAREVGVEVEREEDPDSRRRPGHP